MITPNPKSTPRPSQTILDAIASFPTEHDEYNWRPGQETAEDCNMVLGTPKEVFVSKHFVKASRK